MKITIDHLTTEINDDDFDTLKNLIMRVSESFEDVPFSCFQQTHKFEVNCSYEYMIAYIDREWTRWKTSPLNKEFLA